MGDALEFDLAIVDEATQLTVPSILGALRFARRFVLVGDEKQLPPLVMSEQAAEQGLKRSLFASLLEHWGDVASVALRRQYRMHPTICEFASREFYDDALVTAGEGRRRCSTSPSRRMVRWPPCSIRHTLWSSWMCLRN